MRILWAMTAFLIVLGMGAAGASALTHLNVPPGDMVTLVWDVGDHFWRKLNAAGVLGANAFDIPAGRALVITDVRCVVEVSPVSSPSCTLRVRKPGTVNSNLLWYGFVPINASQDGQTETTFSGGLVVGSKAILTGESNASAYLFTVHGYLTDYP